MPTTGHARCRARSNPRSTASANAAGARAAGQRFLRRVLCDQGNRAVRLSVGNQFLGTRAPAAARLTLSEYPPSYYAASAEPFARHAAQAGEASVDVVVVGVGMRSPAGVASTLFEALASRGLVRNSVV